MVFAESEHGYRVDGSALSWGVIFLARIADRSALLSEWHVSSQNRQRFRAPLGVPRLSILSPSRWTGIARRSSSSLSSSLILLGDSG